MIPDPAGNEFPFDIPDGQSVLDLTPTADTHYVCAKIEKDDAKKICYLWTYEHNSANTKSTYAFNTEFTPL